MWNFGKADDGSPKLKLLNITAIHQMKKEKQKNMTEWKIKSSVNFNNAFCVNVVSGSFRQKRWLAFMFIF